MVTRKEASTRQFWIFLGMQTHLINLVNKTKFIVLIQPSYEK